MAAFLNPELRGKSKLVDARRRPGGGGAVLQLLINARNNPKFNSVATRVDQIWAAIHVWHLSPILGEGMRFYYLPQFIAVTAPPNVFIDNLASSGIVGSLAFVFMVCVTVRTMFRLPYALGTLGLVILVFHYVDGLFDIFWIGASSIGPFIIAGISLGMADMDKVARRAGESGTADARAAPATTGRPARRPSAPAPTGVPTADAGWMSAVTTGLAAGSSAVTARLAERPRR